MCCFSRAVSSVGATQIFARRLDDGPRQALVYSMTLSFSEELAMILPLPVATAVDHIEFLNLSHYRTFFSDLAKCFPPPKPPPGVLAATVRTAPPPQQLAVHDVGDYVASFVPQARDFERLDPRFRLPTSLAELHDEYADWGFAVFQLKPGRRPSPAQTTQTTQTTQTVQPMAFTFASRRPDAIFFPTLHIHDGQSVEPLAQFDHQLTLQTADPLLAQTLRWRQSEHRVGKFVSPAKTGVLTAPKDIAHRTLFIGKLPNQDTWIEPPVCSGLDRLSGRGERFSFTLDVSAVYRPATSDKERRQKRVAQSQIDALHAGLQTGLSELCRTKSDAWGLTTPPPPTFWQRLRGDEIPRLWLSGRTPFVLGPNGLEALPAGTPGPYEIEIGAETEAVPRQTVSFRFARIPSAEIVEEIERAIAALLDRSLCP